jgi:hypothetical protein
MHTVVDLSVQKRLRLGRLDADLFLEVFNLFNQKDASSSLSEYGWWGLLLPYPNDDNYLTYGDASDRSRYMGSPRQGHVGIRLKF